MKPFWEYSPAAGRSSDEVNVQWAKISLGERAFVTGECLYSFSMNGDLRLDINIAELRALFINEGLHPYLKHLPSRDFGDDEMMLISDNSAVWLDITPKSRAIRTCFHTLDEKKAELFKTILKENVVRQAQKGKIFVLVSTNGTLSLREFGVAGEDFIPENYRPEVAEGFKHVTADLESSDPCGRIVILDGEPGTGKTHLVRALLNECPNATFILVQSSNITSLGDPGLLPVLMSHRSKKHPLVLVLEDADEALTSRKADNVSAISALLNFSDGIFGALLDMRVIATTNQELKDLDAAVMRDGRLCRRVEVTLLDHEQAERIYQRIWAERHPDSLYGTGTSGFFTAGNFYALGTVYKRAKGSGGESQKTKPKAAKVRIGFHAQEKTPAQELGLNPGETHYTDEGEQFRVREDGQLEMVHPEGLHVVESGSTAVVFDGDKKLGTVDSKGLKRALEEDLEERHEGYVGETRTLTIKGPSDDDDLIDEDPDDWDDVTPAYVSGDGDDDE